MKLLIFLLMNILVVSQSNAVSNSIQWLYTHEYTEIEELISRPESIATIPVINTVGDIWKERDGAIGKEVSPLIAQSLVYHPDIMLGWFHNNPTELDSWLADLQIVLMTNYFGTKEENEKLQALKSNLASTMSLYSGMFEDEAASIFNTISDMTVREF